MNTLVIVLISVVVLGAGYTLYGRHIAKKWGIDPKAETPAVKYNDGKDYVPTNGWTVFSHQFSSIAGAGPVTGAIQAAVFGWLPVLLWILIGGVFFGAVTDFGALYASVKNQGKSMGMLIEKYIGKLGRKLFTIFCWLFSLLIIAVFADMVSGTFNAFDAASGAKLAAAGTNGSAGMVSIMFMVFAVIFGLIQKKFNFSGWKEFLLGVVFIVASFAIGIKCPIVLGKDGWSYVVFAYIFVAAVVPIWLMKQPRDYMTTIMFVCMILGAAVGLIIGHPTMNLPVFTGFTNEKLGTMFPILFVTVACGAVSGFHSLVSSGTSSKTIANEKDMLKVGYGAMILESVLAVLALCVAGAAAAKDGTPADGTPFQIFSRGVAGFFEKMGMPVQVATVFMTMCVSALALTTLDAVARIGKMSSTFGALYDSVLDRYSELTVFFGICFYLINQGYVISSIVAFIALIGSLMVSYVRARAEGLGLECKVGFMQRPERVVLTGLGALCCGIFAPMMENNEIFEPIMIFVIPLLIVAIFSNITAFARLNHCRKLLSSKDNE